MRVHYKSKRLFFDPKNYPNLSSKKRWIIQKDKRLREQAEIEMLDHSDFHLSDALELKRLYDLLYLEKYSYFNPAFTVRFLRRRSRKKRLFYLASDIKGV
jgi:hypothetical protein